MPVQTGPGGTSVTGNAIWGLRGVIVIQGLRTHLKFNGKLRLSRMATPGALVRIASEFTGRTYKNTRKGQTQALADMEALQAGRSLDELGETAVVNREVGGEAADLTTDCDHCGQPAKGQQRNRELCEHCGAILPAA